MPVNGFVLPTVLVVISIVTLIFLVALTAMASLTREASMARARVAFAQQAMTTEARLTWLLATERLSPNAVLIGAPLPPGEFQTLTPEADAAFRAGMVAAEPLYLDGRPYRIEDRALIRIQDQGGLINLARLPVEELRRLLARLGVSALQTRSIEGALRDYMDPDDLTAPNGAERDAYSNPAQAPPNRPLRTPDEFLSVRGVREAIDPAAWRQMRPHLAADPLSFRRNINTAGLEALQILFGMTETQARATIEARQSEPFYSLDAVAARTGAAVSNDVEISSVYPSGRVIYIVDDTLSPWSYAGRLTVTPTNPERPFWIDLTEFGEMPRSQQDGIDAAEFPAPPL